MAFRLKSFSCFQSFFLLRNVNANKKILFRRTAHVQSKESRKGFVQKSAFVIGGLGIGGGLYSYLAAPDRKDRAAINLTVKDYTVKYEIPNLKPSREVFGPATDLGLDLTLYQYQTCPFCCKVRAFLDFYGIPYKVIEVNPVMRQQVKFSSYKKVPILIVTDKEANVKYQLNDSSAIISILGTFLLNSKEKIENVLKLYAPHVHKDVNGKNVEEVLNRYFLMYGDRGEKEKEESENAKNERIWRQWADNELVHILSPNIYRTYDEALQAFNYFSEVGEWEKNFSALERFVVIYVGATAMYFIGKKLKKKYALKEDERQSLYDAGNKWTKAIGSKNNFMGGDLPNLSDLAVYGLLSSIEGCRAFQDLLDNSKIGTWYYNVKGIVSNHAGYKLIK